MLQKPLGHIDLTCTKGRVHILKLSEIFCSLHSAWQQPGGQKLHPACEGRRIGPQTGSKKTKLPKTLGSESTFYTHMWRFAEVSDLPPTVLPVCSPILRPSCVNSGTEVPISLVRMPLYHGLRATTNGRLMRPCVIPGSQLQWSKDVPMSPQQPSMLWSVTASQDLFTVIDRLCPLPAIIQTL